MTANGIGTTTLAPPRQHEVLAAIAHNLTNKEIASNLQVSEGTAKSHVSSLLDKFGVQRGSDLLLEAFDLTSFAHLHKRQASPQASMPQDESKASRLPDPVAVSAGGIE